MKGKTVLLGEKHAPMPLYSPQIPCGLHGIKSGPSTMRSQYLTASVMFCSPHHLLCRKCYVSFICKVTREKM